MFGDDSFEQVQVRDADVRDEERGKLQRNADRVNEMLSLSAQKELDDELNGGHMIPDLDDKLNALAQDLFGDEFA